MVNDYTKKIKEICDALGFINVTMDEDEMVHIYLGGLAQYVRTNLDDYLHKGDIMVVF